MHIEIINKDSFCVIGKEGSTDMGTGFIQKLWNEANTPVSYTHLTLPTIA